MKNLAFHRLLRCKMITLPILTTSPIYTFLFKKVGIMYVLNLGVKEMIILPILTTSLIHVNSYRLENVFRRSPGVLFL